MIAALAFVGLACPSPLAAASPSPADEPGALLSKEPMTNAPAGARAWRIRYASRSRDGAIVDITGIVVVPEHPAPAAGRDVVAWAHSTVGIAEDCAPSTSKTVFTDIAGLKDMLAAGYAVVATDFRGLGTPGPQPYLVGVSSGRAVLDSVRAAHAIAEAATSDRVVLWGASQGAHAVLWAARLAPTYAPTLDVLGVAAAAPPTDLAANFDRITNPAIRALMTGYTSASWSRIYHIDLATFANLSGRVFIRLLATQCVRVDPIVSASLVGMLVMSRQLPKHLGNPWKKPLQENSAAPMKLAAPMLLAQGTADPVVIPAVTRAFAAASCRAGESVRFVSIEGGEHTTIAERSEKPTLAWIAGRFAHDPAPSDCGRIEAEASAK